MAKGGQFSRILQIAIALDNVVYSAPNVKETTEDGYSEILGKFTVEEALDLAKIIKSGKLDAPVKIVAEDFVNNNGMNTNSSSFSGLPGGMNDILGRFLGVRYSGFWWSSTKENSDAALGLSLIYKESEVGMASYSKGSGLSVRCLKD